MIYRFRDFQLDLRRGLTRHGAQVDVQPKVLDALLLLIERRGEVVSRDELAGHLWPDVHVTKHSLDQVIHRLRLALDDATGEDRLIRTVHRRGYRFTGPVVRVDPHTAPADSFIGREDELERLHEALCRPALVTLLGMGGIGKTRLGRELAARLEDPPACFVDLSACTTDDALYRAASRALGIHVTIGDPEEQLATALANRGRLLLVLDGCELAAPAVRRAVTTWRAAASELSVLVTSRVPLGLPDERRVHLEPLAPAMARRLFLDRARAARPDLDPDGGLVDTLVARMDPIPLAVELIAARARLFALPELLDLVTDLGSLSAPEPRNTTMDAMVQWSWELLSDLARKAVTHASVFAGAFTLEGIAAVLDLGVSRAAQAVEEVHDAGLCHTELGAGATRFTLYDLVRSFARTRLSEPDAEARHAAFFGGLGTDEALRSLRRHGGLERRRRLADHVDDLVAAAGRDVPTPDAVRCGLAAAAVLEFSGPLKAGTALLEGLLNRPDLTPAEEARLRAARGRLLRYAARAEEGARDLARAAALHEACGEAAYAAEALALCGMVLPKLGRPEEGFTHLERALKLALQAGDLLAEGMVLAHRAIQYLDLGRTAEARADGERALAILRKEGDRFGEGRVLGDLGVCLVREGRLLEGRQSYEDSLVIRREIGDRMGEAILLTNLGSLHLESGRPDQAEEAYQAALAIHRSTGSRRSEPTLLVTLGVLHSDRGDHHGARPLHRQAALVARELGHRFVEAYALGNLAELDLLEGRIAEAEATLLEALALSRAVADQRHLGILLGTLGRARTASGRFAEAEAALDEGEALLRRVGDRHRLGVLLCARVVLERARGLSDEETLAQVEHLATELGLAPQAPLRRELAELRKPGAPTS